jgi:hypothetical protein
MKACNGCQVNVRTKGEFCPLCGTALVPATAHAARLPENDYPDLTGAAAQYNLFFRLALFLSLLSAGLSVLVNLLVPAKLLWCLIVVAALAYLWLTVPPLLRRGANHAKRTMYQAVFTSLMVTALDFIIGYRGWSIAYAVPALLDAAIVAVGLMVMFNRTGWSQYIFYQMLTAVFGFAPLTVYLMGFANNLVMVLVTAGLALASLLLTIIFGEKSIKNDFRRRFHV